MQNKLIVSKKLVHICNNATDFVETLKKSNSNKFVVFGGVVFTSSGDTLVTTENLVIVDRILLPSITDIMDASPSTSPATVHLGDVYTYNKDKADKFFSGVKPDDLIIFNGPHLATFISDIDKKCKYIHLTEEITLCINTVNYNFVKNKNRGGIVRINKDEIEFHLYKTLWTAAYYDSNNKMQFKELNNNEDILEFIGGINNEKV